MKKILFVALAVLLIAGAAYAGRPSGPGSAGTIESNHGGPIWTPTRTFTLVRVLPGNMHSGATLRDPVLHEVSDGSTMIWWTGTSGADGVTVAPCSLMTYDSRVAGVLVTSTLISYDSNLNKNYTYATDDYMCDNWGFIQTYGPCYMRVSAPVSVGDAIAPAYYITGTAAPFHPGIAAASGDAGTANPQKLGYMGFVLEGDTAIVAADDNFVRCFLRVK